MAKTKSSSKATTFTWSRTDGDETVEGTSKGPYTIVFSSMSEDTATRRTRGWKPTEEDIPILQSAFESKEMSALPSCISDEDKDGCKTIKIRPKKGNGYGLKYKRTDDGTLGVRSYIPKHKKSGPSRKDSHKSEEADVQCTVL